MDEEARRYAEHQMALVRQICRDNDDDLEAFRLLIELMVSPPEPVPVPPGVLRIRDTH